MICLLQKGRGYVIFPIVTHVSGTVLEHYNISKHLPRQWRTSTVSFTETEETPPSSSTSFESGVPSCWWLYKGTSDWIDSKAKLKDMFISLAQFEIYVYMYEFFEEFLYLPPKMKKTQVLSFMLYEYSIISQHFLKSGKLSPKKWTTCNFLVSLRRKNGRFRFLH